MSTTLSKTQRNALEKRAARNEVLLWADDAEMVNKLYAHLIHTCVTLPHILTMASPLGQDANDLLLKNELRNYVQQVLKL